MPDEMPESYKAMYAFSRSMDNLKVLSKIQKELIKIRASQINGCAFCLNMHSTDARKLGETEQRIYLLNAWRETPLYTEEERALLALTEEVTLVSQKGLTEATYQEAVKHFGVQGTAEIVMAVTVINAWNRIAIASLLPPAL